VTAACSVLMAACPVRRYRKAPTIAAARKTMNDFGMGAEFIVNRANLGGQVLAGNELFVSCPSYFPKHNQRPQKNGEKSH